MRIGLWRARLTRAERVVLVLLALQPVVWLVAGFVALGSAWPVLALGLGVPLAALVVAAALLAIARLRRRRRALAHPQLGGLLGASIGEHVDTAGLALDSALADRRRAVERLAASATSNELLLAGQASRALLLRDALALRATAGRFDLAALLAVAASSDEAGWRDVDAAALAALVRVLASSSERPEGFSGLLGAAVRLAPAIAEPHRVALAGILIEEGDLEGARRVLAAGGRASWGRRAAETDLLNPALSSEGDSVAWLAAFNAPFAASGLEPIALVGDAGRVPFDRLAAPTAAPGSVRGDLVSVIMTVHRPDSAVVGAVASIVAQTWSDWELLVVDDASGAEYDAVLDEIAALDARVRVIRAASNAGTYTRRNDGWDAAVGEYVTFHDSDDWSHPRRLELQVRALEARPAAPGVVVSAVRVTSDLGLWQHRGADLRLCEPSLLVRREGALRTAGYFDEVRRGADVEYRERLGAVAGADVVFLRTAGPLVFMRADRATLSGGDFSEGWAHPARIVYRSLHRASRRRPGSLRRDRGASRTFPAPDHLTGRDVLHDHDLVLVADLGSGRVRRRDRRRLVAWVARARRAGRSVAVRPASTALTASADRDLDARLLTALLDAGAEVRVIGERVAAREVVITDPELLLAFPEGIDDGADVDRVTILDPVARRSPISRRLVEELVRRRWGVDPSWAPEPSLG